MHSLLTFAISSVALCVALWAIFVAYSALKYLEVKNSRSVSLSKLTKLEAELTEVTDSIAQLHESLHKLRSRVGMRALREKQKENGSGIPDSKTDPDGWKQAMRLQLHQQKFK